MSDFDYDVDGVIGQLEGLARRVPEAVPEAVNAMADILVSNLKKTAPFDTMNSYDDHLVDLIGKTKVTKSKKGNPYIVVHVKKRGYKDKHVYKAVVAEYGRENRSQNLRGAGKSARERVTEIEHGSSRLAARPFWRQTVNASEDEMHEAAKDVIENAINGK